jgi:branched-chain amino acid transport system permease protein
MHDLAAVIIAGAVSGAFYALLALGLVIIFRSTDTLNFAIGDIGTLSVFVASSAISAGLPVLLGLGLAIVVAGLFGVAAERLLIRPLGRGRYAIFVALVMTIGLGLVIQASILTIWGDRAQAFPHILDGTTTIFGIALERNMLLAACVTLVAMSCITWFFRSTRLGSAMRAAAEDSFAARLVGIDPRRISALGWFLGCGLAAVPAFFLAALTSLNVGLTIGPLFRAFAGVFLGGLNSMAGAAAGGFAIGILDNLAGRYVSADYRDTIVFSVIVAILFLRPAGVLGVGRSERV